LNRPARNQSDTFTAFKHIQVLRSFLALPLPLPAVDTNSSGGNVARQLKLFSISRRFSAAQNFLFRILPSSKLNVCQFSIQSALNAMNAPIVTSVKCFRHLSIDPSWQTVRLLRYSARQSPDDVPWRSSCDIAKHLQSHFAQPRKSVNSECFIKYKECFGVIHAQCDSRRHEGLRLRIITYVKPAKVVRRRQKNQIAVRQARNVMCHEPLRIQPATQRMHTTKARSVRLGKGGRDSASISRSRSIITPSQRPSHNSLDS